MQVQPSLTNQYLVSVEYFIDDNPCITSDYLTKTASIKVFKNTVKEIREKHTKLQVLGVSKTKVCRYNKNIMINEITI